MNNLSLGVISLLDYNGVIRDTLEFTLNKPAYELKAYEIRKKAIKEHLTQPTLLKQFMDNNKEVGQKINDKINDLYATIYADDSTICRVANNELRVDQGQHLAIFDKVIPLHSDLERVVAEHIQYAQKNNLFEQDLIKVVVADEKFYRSIVFLALFRELQKLFFEFNKTMNESKGQPSPQSNFIRGELVRVTKHLYFCINDVKCREIELWDVVDKVRCIVEQATGRRMFPKEKKIPDIFAEVDKMIVDYLKKAQEEYTALMAPVIKEIQEKQKNNPVKSDEKKN